MSAVPDSIDLGLFGLEQAFISAWDTNHIGLASKLINKAKAFLAQERLAKINNPHLLRTRKVWLNYEYKLQLLELLDQYKGRPDDYADAANRFPLPCELVDKSEQEANREYLQECKHFKRYIIAATYCETNPKKCASIMEQLCRETQSSNFSFMLFKGRVTLYEINNDAPGLRNALAQFLVSLGDCEPEHMPLLWQATILDVYRQLQDSTGADDFWNKLNPDQHARREVLHPYCKALMARGDALIAQQKITNYRELNHQPSVELGITDLINELLQVLPSEQSMSQLVQVINEDSQRSTVQLTKHYSQIVSKEFKEYVAIVGQGAQPTEFLKM